MVLLLPSSTGGQLKYCTGMANSTSLVSRVRSTSNGPEKLAISLQFLLRHWGIDDKLGRALRYVFELSQLEIGLSGNYLFWDYYVYGGLVTHSWFKLLLEYIQYYDGKVELEGIDITPVRERDQVLMEAVTQILPSNQWESFNRARKYYRVYFLSQIILCDGMTVDPTMLQSRNHTQRESTMVFPKEEPTYSDFQLWRDTICLLTSPSFHLSPRLGNHQRMPYDKTIWLTNGTRTCILLQTEGHQPVVY